MSKYKSINNLKNQLESMSALKSYENLYEMIPLLELLEKVNPCDQEYELIDDNIIISYSLKLNLFNFKNIFPLRAKVQIIGLPVSVCEKGYWGEAASIENVIQQRKGLKVLLNGDTPFKGGGKTLSTFVFENKYSSFDEYLDALRSPYRRRINQALKHRDSIEVRKINREDFNENHYKLYLSIMDRTDNPLETLPIEFFTSYEAELYEFINIKTKDVLAFIQLKEIKDKNDTLYFLFGGFRKEDNEAYDIYYNMLLKIIETGIEKQVKTIEFGQTAEESKLKIGCREKCKYLYVHHSNPVLNFFIQHLVPLFSYKTYNIKHHVFKDSKRD
ncbi:MAG: hypothetical protein AAGU76_11605 [Sedimentibacter sp.]|uniref:hypothetical protein n=1 Tax=Sedimentibacter sp. TaxID=1960295 RepID=UPI0031588E40